LDNCRDEKLLPLLLRYVDVERLLAENPEIARSDVESFLTRLCLRATGGETKTPAAHKPPRTVVANCDGASRGNPGPAAIGVVLTDATGRELAAVAEPIGRATNNVAEYSAVVRAATMAHDLGADELRLLLDSELLVRQLNGTYRVRAPHLRKLHARALEALDRIPRWSVQHVPRARNARADALANAALDGTLPAPKAKR